MNYGYLLVAMHNTTLEYAYINLDLRNVQYIHAMYSTYTHVLYYSAN